MSIIINSKILVVAVAVVVLQGMVKLSESRMIRALRIGVLKLLRLLLRGLERLGGRRRLCWGGNE